MRKPDVMHSYHFIILTGSRGYSLDQAQGQLLEIEKALQKAEMEIKETADFIKASHCLVYTTREYIS